MKIRITYSFIILGLLILYSCSPSTYIRNAVNSPLFENKNELHTSSYINVGEFDFQMAYSLSSHIGIMANGYTAFPNSYRISKGSFYSMKYDLALGYFINLNEKHYLSAFIGTGQGLLKGDMKRHWAGQWNIEWLDYHTDYNEYYLQLGYYKKTNKWNIGFTMRSNLIYYNSYDYDVVRDEYQSGATPIVFTDTIHKTNVYGYSIDPLINIQLKIHKFRLLGQFGYSISNLDVENLHKYYSTKYNYLTDFNAHPRYQRLIFKIGVQYVLGGKNNKIKNL